MAGYAYPNGVSTSYTYDPLNRLTNMQSNCGSGAGCGVPGTPLASYAYTLGAAGNRLSVAELSGRTVAYGYDDLYRLTSENVSGDPGGKNGAVSYQYDSVGNRVQRNSTLPAVVATGLLNYDANDLPRPIRMTPTATCCKAERAETSMTLRIVWYRPEESRWSITVTVTACRKPWRV